MTIEINSLAVVIPVGPGHKKLAREARQQFDVARRNAPAIGSAEVILIEDEKGKLGRSKARNKGILQAIEKGAEWVLLMDADDVLLPDALQVACKFAGNYDVIWGAIADFQHGTRNIRIRAGQDKRISNVQDLILANPNASLEMGFLARTSCFGPTMFDEANEAGSELKLYLELLRTFRCIKLSETLVAKRWGAHATGARATNPERKKYAVEKIIKTQSKELNLTSSFTCMGHEVTFSITNPLDIIQRSHVSGRFFEELELFALQMRFCAGGNIIDAGANIGNHAVFFSKFYEAGTIYCFECNPQAVELLERNLALNGCQNVEQKFLGMGLSDQEHKGAIDREKTNNLGATSFRKQPKGDVQFKPLDSLDLQNIKLLKVDCEGMDLQVIAGARALIERDRPTLFFECFNEQYASALSLLEELDYKIIHEFGYVNSKNIVAESLYQPSLPKP